MFASEMNGFSLIISRRSSTTQSFSRGCVWIRVIISRSHVAFFPSYAVRTEKDAWFASVSWSWGDCRFFVDRDCLFAFVESIDFFFPHGVVYHCKSGESFGVAPTRSLEHCGERFSVVRFKCFEGNSMFFDQFINFFALSLNPVWIWICSSFADQS